MKELRCPCCSYSGVPRFQRLENDGIVVRCRRCKKEFVVPESKLQLPAYLPAKMNSLKEDYP